MNENTYIKKADDLLQDNFTYKIIARSKTLLESLQDSAKEILQDWNRKGHLSKIYKDIELTQTDTILPKFYGLSKIHKGIACPLRPIVSSINSPTYLLAKNLDRILKECCTPFKYVIKNSLQAPDKLKNISVPDDHVLISLDATSLYTNNYFSFNGHIYKQIFGMIMGNPVSSFLADLVMDDLESNCLNSLDFSPLFYIRFADDIPTCIPHSKINYILNDLNSYDTNLKFTYELEKDSKISFLDLQLVKIHNRIITDCYQIPTYSGRVLNFGSNHPKY